MSRGNIFLLAALVVAAGAWLLGRDWERGRPSGPAQRLFPEFSRSAASRIEISGGPSGVAWAFTRKDTSWVLESAGGYPVKASEADRFLDAVANLRKDNEAGATDDLRERTRTDEKNGRLVRVLDSSGRALAEFYVGKKPEREYNAYFVRKAKDLTIYRTHTLLTKDRDAPVTSDPYATASGFSWNDYLNDISARWVDPTIWDLTGAEVQELWLGRTDQFKATVRKQAQDKWELIEEGKEPVPADADVADGILQVVRRLSLYDVLGTFDGVGKEYGLDEPETRLVMTLRKKVEKPAPKEGEGEKKEGEGEKKEGEEKPEEYVTLTRTIDVGRKFTRQQYDDYSGEMKSVDYYAVHVGLEKDMDDPEEKKRAGFVFLVRDYTAGAIRKDFTDLVAKPKEEEKGPGDEGDESTPEDEKPAGEEKPGAEEPAEPEGEKPPEQPGAGGEQPGGDGKEKDEGCGCGESEGGEGEKEGCGEGEGGEGEKEGCGCGEGEGGEGEREGCGCGEGEGSEGEKEGCGCGEGEGGEGEREGCGEGEGPGRS